MLNKKQVKVGEISKFTFYLEGDTTGWKLHEYELYPLMFQRQLKLKIKSFVSCFSKTNILVKFMKILVLLWLEPIVPS